MISVLYVDDEPVPLEMTKLSLEKGFGFSVDTAISAHDALEHLKIQRYDLIISDYQMPEMDGIELLKLLRRTGNAIPFILFTGRGQEEVVDDAYNAGVDSFLVKGGDPRILYMDLARRIEQIVSHKKTEQALQFSNILLSTQLETSMDGILVVDEHGAIISSNTRFMDMWNIPVDVIAPGSDECALLSVLGNLVDFEASSLSANYLSDRRDEKSHEEIVLKDSRVFDQYSAPMVESDGEYYGRVWHFRDITARRQAEEALREDEDKSRMIFENSNDAIFLMEVAREGEICRIIDVNSVAVRQTGYSKEELLSGSAVGIDFPTLIQRLPSTISELLAGGNTTFESDVTRKDGILLPVEVNIQAVQFKNTSCIIVTIRDISRRKRTEETLQKSVADLARAQQVANIGNWSLDPATNEVAWSDQMYEIFTIPRSSLITRDLYLATIHPDDSEHVIQVLTEALNGSLDFFDLEYRIIIQGGHIRNIYELAEISRDEQGTPLLVFGTAQDVTERILAEMICRESELKYRTLIESANEGIFIIQDGFVPYGNPKAMEIMGFSADEFAGNHFLELVHPDDRQETLERYQKRIRGEFDEPIAYSRIIDRNNNVHWLEINAVRILWNGRPATLNFVTDITRRRRAEEALRESEENYRMVVENISDVFYRTDKNGILTMISSSLKTVLGYDSVEECLGQSIAEKLYFEPEKRRDFLEVLLKNGSVKDFEVTLKRKDGSPVTVATSSQVYYDESGNVLRIEGVFRDITERKRTEAALVESLHEKELLLKEIHHRVKNNLQTISSLLYLQSLSTDNIGQISLLREARSRVISMGLIHQKLYQSADIAHIQFMDYIRGLIDFLEESYGVDPDKIQTFVDVSPSDLTMDLDTGIPCGLIINELVTNALKYAFREYGCGTIRIRMERDEHEYLLTVSDDGVGIPEDLDLSTVKSLGMTIVTDLVSQLDGSLEIIRQPGATFRIRFPDQK
ncbi:PAS domain S-box protein [Methanosphaerula palustris]|uniref:PAS domain S-box protein n=1 Tax=Methanosphaerula palustris TaxID=475088 RepID=UPI00032254EB|nr:PAS domain S-box protein [Methanosphaerula palustris]